MAGHSVSPKTEAAERGSTAACVSAIAKLRRRKQSIKNCVIFGHFFCSVLSRILQWGGGTFWNALSIYVII